MEIFLIIIVSYLLGSIPFGFLLTKIFLKKDIRKIGSGNIGATNALRTGNKAIGYSTLLLDILKAGKVLNARDIGLAASMNLPWLSVRQKPRIAILATGDEIVMPGDAVGANQIVSSNGLALTSFITALGGFPIDLGIAPDSKDTLQIMAAGAKGTDMLITCGGASVGDHDLVQKVLSEIGLEIDFWKIAMRPGKPRRLLLKAGRRRYANCTFWFENLLFEVIL